MLVSPTHSARTALSFPQFRWAVRATKGDYQACRYERVLDRLVTLLPSLDTVNSGTEGEQRSQIEVLTAGSLERDTRLATSDAVAVYGSLVLRGAVAAARADDRDTAHAVLDEATHAATRLGYDGNDRWAGFGAVNVLLHRVNIALTLGDAGTAIAIARTAPLDNVPLAERKASLFVDVARAYTQWGRYGHGLHALRTAYEVAPEEIRYRPSVQRIAGDLAMLAKGSVQAAAASFAQCAGIRL